MPRDLFQDAGVDPRIGLKTNSAPTASPTIDSGALNDTILDLPRYGFDAVRSLAMGAGDLAMGAGQLATHVLPDVALRPMARAADYVAGGNGDIGGQQKLVERYNGAMRNQEEAYQGGRAYPALPDVGRFTGSLVAGSAIGPTRAAATLGARILQGARSGATLGLLSPVDPDAGSYATAKGVQVGGGTVLGGLAVPTFEGLVRGTALAVDGLTKAVRGLKATVSGEAGANTIAATLETELGRQGVKWSEMPMTVRDTLIAEVQRSVKAGGKLDPQAIGRLADFRRLNMEPLQGQITRDPLVFSREQNYARVGQVGAPLRERLEQQNTQMIGALDELRAGTGATGADTYSAGQNVIAGLRAQDATRKAAVNEAYTSARGLAGIESEVPPQLVAQRIGKVIEDFGEEAIPKAVLSRLQSFGMLGGKQTKSFSIREAEGLKTLIGNNIENPVSPTGKALTLLKQSVDDAISGVGDAAGGEAASAFQNARGMAARRFGILDRTPALSRAVSEPGAPEKFIEANIIRGSIEDVANNLRQMRPQDRSEVRAAVLDWIGSKAVTGAADTAKISQASLNRALQTVGDRKLELIFAGDREALGKLQALQRVAAYIGSPPVAAGVNYSASGTTGIDFLDQLGHLPVLGALGRPGNIVRSAQVASSLSPVPTQAPRGILSGRVVDTAAPMVGVLSSPAASLTGSQALEQPTKARAILLGR